MNKKEKKLNLPKIPKKMLDCGLTGTKCLYEDGCLKHLQKWVDEAIGVSPIALGKSPKPEKKCICVCHRLFPKIKGYCQSCAEFHKSPKPEKKVVKSVRELWKMVDKFDKKEREPEKKCMCEIKYADIRLDKQGNIRCFNCKEIILPMEKKVRIDVFIDAWWNRTLKMVDLDRKDYKIIPSPTEKQWKASVKRDLLKVQQG